MTTKSKIRRFPSGVVSALAPTLTLLVVGGVLPSTASALTPNQDISDLASLVAHQPIQAVCGTSDADWQTAPGVAYWTAQGSTPDGTADIPGATIYLSPWVCQNVTLRTATSGVAALVVTHEAMHVALYSWDEARVECVAGQNVWTVVHALALPRRAERNAYRAAMVEHQLLGNDPTGTYAWKGHC